MEADMSCQHVHSQTSSSPFRVLGLRLRGSDSIRQCNGGTLVTFALSEAFRALGLILSSKRI